MTQGKIPPVTVQGGFGSVFHRLAIDRETRAETLEAVDWRSLGPCICVTGTGAVT